MHNAQCTIFCNFADVKLYGCRVVYKKRNTHCEWLWGRVCLLRSSLLAPMERVRRLDTHCEWVWIASFLGIKNENFCRI